jgi:hypothetical protein
MTTNVCDDCRATSAARATRALAESARRARAKAARRAALSKLLPVRDAELAAVQRLQAIHELGAIHFDHRPANGDRVHRVGVDRKPGWQEPCRGIVGSGGRREIEGGFVGPPSLDDPDRTKNSAIESPLRKAACIS